jgi:hypothetical protein
MRSSRSRRVTWLVMLSLCSIGPASALAAPTDVYALVAVVPERGGAYFTLGNRQGDGWAEFVISKFQPDGSPDPGFGVGGVVTHAFTDPADQARDLAAFPDGRLVVVGGRAAAPFATMFEADGRLHTRFGDAGQLVIPLLNNYSARLVEVAVLDATHFVVQGQYDDGTGAHPMLAVVSDAGELDRSFDLDGVLVVRDLTALPGRIAVDSEGRMLVAVRGPTEVTIMRFARDGLLDRSFGVDGRAVHTTAIATPIVGLVLRDDVIAVAGRARGHVARFDGQGRFQFHYDLVPDGNLSAVAPIGPSLYAVVSELPFGSQWQTHISVMQAQDHAPAIELERMALADGVGATVLDVTYLSPRIHAVGYRITADGTVPVAGTLLWTGLRLRDVPDPPPGGPPAPADRGDTGGGGGDLSLGLAALFALRFRSRAAATARAAWSTRA